MVPLFSSDIYIFSITSFDLFKQPISKIESLFCNSNLKKNKIKNYCIKTTNSWKDCKVKKKTERMKIQMKILLFINWRKTLPKKSVETFGSHQEDDLNNKMRGKRVKIALKEDREKIKYYFFFCLLPKQILHYSYFKFFCKKNNHSWECKREDNK